MNNSAEVIVGELPYELYGMSVESANRRMTGKATRHQKYSLKD
jgi:hypothetical protein